MRKLKSMYEDGEKRFLSGAAPLKVGCCYFLQNQFNTTDNVHFNGEMSVLEYVKQ